MWEMHPTHTDLPPVSNEGAIILEPEAILDHRWVKQGGNFLAESLVKWKHLPTEEATWEVTESLCHQFPNLNFEDKVPLSRRGIDKPPRRSERATKPNPKYSEVQ